LAVAAEEGAEEMGMCGEVVQRFEALVRAADQECEFCSILFFLVVICLAC
jgi:hypothetical protein